MRRHPMMLVALLALTVAAGCDDEESQEVCDFTDLTLAAESYWDGSTGDATTYFDSGTARFYTNYDPAWMLWDGFAFSNTTNTPDATFTNQFSAKTGTGIDGPIYAVAWENTFAMRRPRVEFTDTDTGYRISGIWVTNTTYAYGVIRDGNEYAKPFGGTSGEDPDWFKLVIHGLDAQDAETGTVEFYLADYRGEPAEDYIVDTWEFVDLTSLGAVRALEFSLESSDTGQFGMNTPAYFALGKIMKTGK